MYLAQCARYGPMSPSKGLNDPGAKGILTFSKVRIPSIVVQPVASIILVKGSQRRATESYSAYNQIFSGSGR